MQATLEKSKEWDKATGVYVHSLEHTTNFTVIFNSIATNMWDSHTLGQDTIASYQLVAATIVLAVLILSSVIFVARGKDAHKIL